MLFMRVINSICPSRYVSQENKQAKQASYLFYEWEPGNIVNFAFVDMGISPGQFPSPYKTIWP
jgi:hypothetical protein